MQAQLFGREQNLSDLCTGDWQTGDWKTGDWQIGLLEILRKVGGDDRDAKSGRYTVCCV